MAKRVKKYPFSIGKYKFSLGMKKHRALGFLAVILVALALVAAKWAGLPVDFLLGNETQRTRTSQRADLAEGTYLVERVVDGDTLILANATRTRIRLIGADTPETVKPNTPVQPFGPEASQFTKDAIARNGNKVRISFDGDQVDRYGRTLAMVWLGDTLLNEQLIRVGLARAQLQYKYSREMKNRFKVAEDQAKRAKRGIWSLAKSPFS